jgi:hypothetical protein
MSDEPKSEKKIFVDEDWKSKVEAERSAAAEQTEPAQAEPASEHAQAHAAWPEPSLPLLVTTLATQAMSAFGFMPHPVTGKTAVDLPQAKHFIDTIDMLDRKTAGNQTPEERDMFESVLHELRMTFVAVSNAQGQP